MKLIKAFLYSFYLIPVSLVLGFLSPLVVFGLIDTVLLLLSYLITGFELDLRQYDWWLYTVAILTGVLGSMLSIYMVFQGFKNGVGPVGIVFRDGKGKF